MNIKELKEKIKDLPDEMTVAQHHPDDWSAGEICHIATVIVDIRELNLLTHRWELVKKRSLFIGDKCKETKEILLIG
jgi:hypothetical protein